MKKLFALLLILASTTMFGQVIVHNQPVKLKVLTLGTSADSLVVVDGTGLTKYLPISDIEVTKLPWLNTTNTGQYAWEINSNPFIHDYSGNTDRAANPYFSNTFVGEDAGNYSVGDGLTGLGVQTGLGNVGVGASALKALTTGGWNIAIGTENLGTNTTGYNNTAIGGGGVMYYNTIGFDNTAIGAQAMIDNISGSKNVAIGKNALGNLTTGTHNTAVGENAGLSASVGSVTTNTKGVFIGNYVKASADGTTNEIVIGEGAIGIGSNTAIIGNNNITKISAGADYVAVDAEDLVTKGYADATYSGGGGGNVSTSGTPVINDFARFVNATDIEGRSYAETVADLGVPTLAGTNTFVLEQTVPSLLVGASGTNELVLSSSSLESYVTLAGGTNTRDLRLESGSLGSIFLNSVAEVGIASLDITGNINATSNITATGHIAGGISDKNHTAANYTTVAADNGKHIIFLTATPTTITLDDAAVNTSDQFNFVNQTGSPMSFAFGTGDTAYQGTLPDLPDGNYAWATKQGTNLWSVVVGGDLSNYTTKAGTMAQYYIARWANDGAITGGSNLTFDGFTFTLPTASEIKFGTEGRIYTSGAGGIELNVGGQTVNSTVNLTSGTSGAINIDGGSGGINFLDDAVVPDQVYGVGWNGSFEIPTKNAIYDKIETISGGGGLANVVEDLTPQLGGNLDMNTKAIQIKSDPGEYPTLLKYTTGVEGAVELTGGGNTGYNTVTDRNTMEFSAPVGGIGGRIDFKKNGTSFGSIQAENGSGTNARMTFTTTQGGFEFAGGTVQIRPKYSVDAVEITATTTLNSLDDLGQVYLVNSASAINITINVIGLGNNTRGPGQVITFIQKGAGAFTLVAGSGVIIDTKTTLVSDGQWSIVEIMCLREASLQAVDWLAYGNLVP